MTKTFLCLALLCLFTTSFAQDCKNPLLAVYGFKPLDNPVSGSDLKFCKSLQKGTTCCSADTISAIQDKVKTLGQKLSDLVAARDKLIVETRDKVIPALQQGLTNVKNALNNAKTALQSDPKYAVQLASTEAASQMTSAFDTFGQQAINASPGLKKGFNNFQKSRTSCVVDLLKLQSAAWCLACDPNYASKGVSGTSITFSNKVCKRLQSSCYSFVAGSVLQNEMLNVQALSGILDVIVSALNKVANKDVTGGITDLMGAFSSQTNTTMAPVKAPDGCTSDTNCNWICNSLLVKGEIDSTALMNGGSAGTVSSMFSLGSRRLSKEEEEEVSVVKNKLSKDRKLGANEWDPDTDEAGVTVTFQDDPANVKTNDDGSFGVRMIGNGFICVIVSLVAFFL